MMAMRGLFGQVLVILPEQGLIIARTAHDDPFADLQADVIITNAMKCFAPDAPGVPQGPPMALKPEPEKAPVPMAIFNDLGDFEHLMSQGTLPGMMAKELCSCHFITGIAVDECLARSPLPPMGAHIITDIVTDEKQQSVIVTPRLSSRPTKAMVNPRTPREGCRLTYGAADL